MKRTILNKLVSYGLWVSVIQLTLVLLSEIIRYMFGPMPKQFCFFQVVIKNACQTQSFLYFDAICLARYLLIFWTENPASVNDDLLEQLRLHLDFHFQFCQQFYQVNTYHEHKLLYGRKL